MKVNTYINVPIADYYHHMDGRLARVVTQVMRHLPAPAVNCYSVELYTLLSDSQPVRVSPVYQTLQGGALHHMTLPSAVMDDIRLQFLIMHDVVCQSEKRVIWNKARVVIRNDDEMSYQFALRYDADVSWLDSLRYAHNTLWASHISDDIQSQVEKWDGLPADYPRFWVG